MTADNPMDIKINAKASANFDSLIKAIPKGLGRLFSLVFAKREANNSRYAALMAAKTKIEYQKIIESGYDFENDCLVPPQPSILQANLNPLQIEDKQESYNLAENIRVAAEILKDLPDDKISDKEVDDDFFARWRREAKVVSNKELQRLWGRLLVEEISQPESVSLRTLDVLKNISNKEASCFRRASKFIIADKILPCNLKINLMPKDLMVDDILTLNAAGLLAVPSSDLVVNILPAAKTVGKNDFIVQMKNTLLSITSTASPLQIPGAVLTEAGKQIFKICDSEQLVKDDFDYIINLLSISFKTIVTSARAVRTDVKNKEDWPLVFVWEYIP